MRYFKNPDVPGSLYTRTDDAAKAVPRHHPTWVEVDAPKRKTGKKKAANTAGHASAQTHGDTSGRNHKE
jgi:hypothetical protein